MVDDGSDGVTNTGDKVTLTYTITNTGNTCLGNVLVDDPSAGTLECTQEFSGTGMNLKLKSRECLRMASLAPLSPVLTEDFFERRNTTHAENYDDIGKVGEQYRGHTATLNAGCG